MAKVSPIQTAMNAGEFAPVMAGRVDFDKYGLALAQCRNWIPLTQGPITRRPGTRYVAAVKTAANYTRLVRFVFSTTQAYVLEFGNLYFRVYKDHAQVQSGGSPVEVVTTYATADLPALKFTQSADTLYITHPSYPPRAITRTSHTTWTITTLTLQDGPYLPTNTTTTTLTPSATTGAVTLTASASLFASTDVGRVVRLQHGSTWSWGVITGYTSATQVTWTIDSATASTAAATANWRLGLYSDTTGYPAAVTFHQDRLVFGGATAAPQRIDGSRTGVYTSTTARFSPSASNGNVADDDAISFTLSSEDVQVIRWLVSMDKGLLAGTTSGEWLVSATSNNEALTPTNVKANQHTSRGSRNVQAVKAGSNSVLFLQRSARKIRELAYAFDVDAFRSPDMNKLAPHITSGGLRDMAFQAEPQQILWCVRNDGKLASLVYERDDGVVGWALHTLGGTAAKVESVCVIPEPNGEYDEVWMVVSRTINGSTVRYIEYLTKLWENGDAAEDGVFVDCSMVYDGAAASAVTGATHLANETVSIWADGATHPNVTVTAGGNITLTRQASVVQVGFSYNSDAQQLRNNAGAADGTAQGKTQRTHRLAVRMMDTLGLKTGPSFDKLTPIIFRTGSDAMGEAVPLYTGDKTDNFDGDYTLENQPCFRVSDPCPATIIAIMPQLHTQDR